MTVQRQTAVKKVEMTVQRPTSGKKRRLSEETPMEASPVVEVSDVDVSPMNVEIVEEEQSNNSATDEP